MKSMKKPTAQARELSELMCKIFGVKPYYDKRTKFNDYWTPGLKLYQGKNFLNEVQNFDVSVLSIETVMDIEETTNSEDFNMDKFRNASSVVYNFARWVLAIIITFRSKQVLEEFEQALYNAR